MAESEKGKKVLTLLAGIRRAPGHEGDYAPHKPLMLLLALARLQRGESRLIPFREVEPKLQTLLAEFARSGAEKTRHLPYWRLKNDHAGQLWEIRDPAGRVHTGQTDPPTLTVLRTSDVVAGFAPPVFDSLRGDPIVIVQAAREILEANFPPSLHEEIAQAVGLDLQETYSEPAERATDSDNAEKRTARRPRNPSFRNDVLLAYEYRCCVCGFDLRVGHMPAGLEAAHIQWHNVGGPDEVPNGLSLCALHHKLFDLGAFTVDSSDLTIIFSRHAIAGDRGAPSGLSHHGKRLIAPQHDGMRPAKTYLDWNKKNVFKAPGREITN